MKLFGRDQNKHTDNVEKPIIYYYAKQIGVLGTNVSSPIQEDTHVHIYEDRIEVELLKDKARTIIPYKTMTDLQNLAVIKYFITTTHSITNKNRSKKRTTLNSRRRS
jgi:hypothetical protein